MLDPADAERRARSVVGAISPFGLPRATPTALDESAFLFPVIYVSGGRRGLEIEVDPQLARRPARRGRSPTSPPDRFEEIVTAWGSRIPRRASIWGRCAALPPARDRRAARCRSSTRATRLSDGSSRTTSTSWPTVFATTRCGSSPTDGPSRGTSTARFLDAQIEEWDECGFGCWIARASGETGQVIGYVGLSVPMFLPEILPAVEVGWRFAPTHWGQGLASEGAEAALREGFTTLGLAEICSLPSSTNPQSYRVCERLGMTFRRLVDTPPTDRRDGVEARLYAMTRNDVGLGSRRLGRTDEHDRWLGPHAVLVGLVVRAGARQRVEHGPGRRPLEPEVVGCKHRTHRDPRRELVGDR